MDAATATSDFIEFLLARGCITHVLSAPEGSTLSTLALTQRCLASGIEFPVPLPDGSVAIQVDGDVPVSLSVLDLAIRDVSETRAVDAPVGSDGTEAGVSTEVYADLGDAPEPVSSDMTAEPLFDDAPLAEPILNEAPMVKPDIEVSEDTPAEDDADEVPMFMRSSPEPGMESDTDSECVELSNPPEEGEWAEVDEALPADAPEEVPVEISAIEGTDMPSDVSPDMVATDTGESLVRVLASLGDIEDRVSAICAAQSDMSAQIASIAGALEAVSDRPAPRPDTSEFNRGMARLIAVFSQVIRRLDSLGDQVATNAKANQPDAAALLRDAFSSLADGLGAPSTATAGSQSDLAMIASMQETLSHQLAKLIELNQASNPPQMEEFLLDLRHATAELLAEQTRLSKSA